MYKHMHLETNSKIVKFLLGAAGNDSFKKKIYSYLYGLIEGEITRKTGVTGKNYQLINWKLIWSI